MLRQHNGRSIALSPSAAVYDDDVPSNWRGLQARAGARRVTVRRLDWRGTWSAAPCSALDTGGDTSAEWRCPDFSGRTIAQAFRISIGGDRLRLHLTNAYSVAPLDIGGARLRWVDASSGERGAPRAVTLAGREEFRIGSGDAVWTDTIELRVPPLARLSLSLFIPVTQGPCTGHLDGGDQISVSAPGNYTGCAFRATATTTLRPILSAVDVQAPFDSPVVVTLGDSITDGYLSSVGCNRRWPDLLAERFACDPQLSNAAVVNAGISGNRLLTPDPLPLFGESALARLDRDVLGVSGCTHVVVLEGINDLCAEPMASAEELVAGLRQIIARVRAKGVRVTLATLLPFVGSAWASQDREHARQTVNKWIVGQAEADGVIDFDAALRDVDQPDRFRSDLHAGDWMHPNDAGYRIMAAAVNLALFRV